MIRSLCRFSILGQALLLALILLWGASPAAAGEIGRTGSVICPTMASLRSVEVLRPNKLRQSWALINQGGDPVRIAFYPTVPLGATPPLTDHNSVSLAYGATLSDDRVPAPYTGRIVCASGTTNSILLYFIEVFP